jgi:hypothetical protein
MTDRDHITWDLTEQAVREAWQGIGKLHATLDDMSTAAAANRLVMAMTMMDEAIDLIAAARARMPDPE